MMLDGNARHGITPCTREEIAHDGVLCHELVLICTALYIGVFATTLQCNQYVINGRL